jgi:hypothetical protein
MRTIRRLLRHSSSSIRATHRAAVLEQRAGAGNRRKPVQGPGIQVAPVLELFGAQGTVHCDIDFVIAPQGASTWLNGGYISTLQPGGASSGSVTVGTVQMGQGRSSPSCWKIFHCSLNHGSTQWKWLRTPISSTYSDEPFGAYLKVVEVE